MSNPTRPGGIPTIEINDLSESLRSLSDQSRQYPRPMNPEPQRPYSPSMAFVVSVSIVFGLILAVGAVIGVMGKAFYVTRTEYDEKTLKDTMESTTVRNTLERVEHVLSAQEASFDKLSDAVQTIKVDMAKKR